MGQALKRTRINKGFGDFHEATRSSTPERLPEIISEWTARRAVPTVHDCTVVMNMKQALIPIVETPDFPLTGCDREFCKCILIAAEGPKGKGG
jgi:hypothetical protein